MQYHSQTLKLQIVAKIIGVASGPESDNGASAGLKFAKSAQKADGCTASNSDAEQNQTVSGTAAAATAAPVAEPSAGLHAIGIRTDSSRRIDS